MRKLILVIFGLISIGVLLFFGVAFNFVYSTPEKVGREVVFEVMPGSFAHTASELKERGLVKDNFSLVVLGRVTGYANQIRVGEYLLKTNMNPLEILKVLSSGKSIQHPITIQEGFNVFEIANVLEEKKISSKEKFLKVCHDRLFLKKILNEELTTCEGYLFPETYFVTKYMSIQKIVEAMIKRFLENYEKIKGTADALGLTRKQVVTLASIIEKETGAPEERALVSSVYTNRIKKKMMLQADPTVLYGLMDLSGHLEKNISKRDLSSPNRYNTYAMKGLPFGPIANPGFDSLYAAVHPATTDYLFFVSKNNGTHVFSKDYGSHNEAVSSFQKNAKAREGKSWRDLKKKIKPNAS